MFLDDPAAANRYSAAYGITKAAQMQLARNWQAETARFRPGLKVGLYHGARRTLDDQADVTITTYPLLRNDIDQLAAIAWDTVVLDEAQAIKNPDSQIARAAYRLRGGWGVSLSGVSAMK